MASMAPAVGAKNNSWALLARTRSGSPPVTGPPRRGRGGGCCPDGVDNLGIASAERIVPELQHLEVGDLGPISPIGKAGLWVKGFEFNRWLLWGDEKEDVTWLWALYPGDSDHTRLITRVRIHYVWTSPTILFSLLLDVGDIV